MRTTRNHILLLVFISITLHDLGMAQESWRIQNRLQVGAFRDDNIFEAGQNKKSSNASSYIFRTQGRRTYAPVRVAYNYSSSLQFYNGHPEEHKYTQILNAELVFPFAKRYQLSGNLGGTAKFFPNAQFDFLYSYTNARFIAAFPKQTNISLGFETAQLQYAETTLFDFLNETVNISVQHNGWKNILWELGFAYGQAEFQRPALKLTDDDADEATNVQQLDELSRTFLRATMGRKYFIRVSIAYLNNASNSIGDSYYGWHFSTVTALRLGSKWLVRAAVDLRDKHYSSSVPGYFLEFDLERSETNSGVIDVSYDISSNLSLMLRLSIYNNESALRGRYYRKNMLFSGVEYRF